MPSRAGVTSPETDRPERVTPDTAKWIDSDAALARAARGWTGVIGLDTEFQRTDTFFPIAGLYQVSCADGIWLIDPLSIEDWQPLVDVLHDPGVVKVMHACSEDLELMAHHLDCAPRGVFDTQYAHAFLSDTFSTSYANLVVHELGIELGKHQTRSDWLRRPLSQEQLHYASEDVEFLIPMYQRQRQALDDLGRLDWFAQDMYQRGVYTRTQPESYFMGVKKAWRLNERELGVLRALCAWRERQAMREDVPRNRVVWDEHLFAFAAMESLQERDVAELLPRPVARRYAGDLVMAHTKANGTRVDLLPRPLTQGQGNVTRRLRSLARECAERHEFAPELLSRKRDVEFCFRHFHDTGELSDFYHGWRFSLIGAQFKQVLTES
ncbi:MAG: HRDC domain-containing protein [Pseudomonadales bacterium]|jgi:ribonuclease D|nr:HRDC domain-containing protein [Pseudomonadales bacterium]MDP6471745.1 HRDC domain-containing protein [Pseudomonadales bacterium]MDP6971423.1 HRDC domain-containing protein [Pseudomonadales bacterium]